MAVDLFDRFLTSNKDNILFGPDRRILLAVSGGMDSMVMLDLFRRSNIYIEVAHMNYNLRGRDSVMDAALVREYCLKYQLKYFQKDIPLGTFPQGNLQEQARNLRYDWFVELTEFDSLDGVATAHHMDDAIETMLMHMMTGSGVQGLAALTLSKTKVIRPMLFTTREEISLYAAWFDVPFREDKSNASLYYRRNLIRHSLVPLLHEIEPRSNKGLGITLEHISQEAGLLQECVDHMLRDKMEFWKDCVRLPSGFGEDLKYREALFYQVFKPYGFKYDQIKSLVRGMEIGAFLEASDHRLCVERSHWYLIPKYRFDSNADSVEIFEQCPFLWTKSQFFYISANQYSSGLKNDRKHLLADPGKLKWPLRIRIRKPGDHIQVFYGRVITKSVKKVLTEAKTDTYSKAFYPVILDAENDIICIPGICMSPKVWSDQQHDNMVSFNFFNPFDEVG